MDLDTPSGPPEPGDPQRSREYLATDDLSTNPVKRCHIFVPTYRFPNQWPFIVKKMKSLFSICIYNL